MNILDKIILFLKTKKSPIHFNKEFKDGYKNLWINNIKDYTP